MPAMSPTGADVGAFVAAIPDEGRRADARTLCSLMQELTGEPPVLWGTSIIGFGSYHYRYASGHEGDAPLASFAPRERATVVYLAGYFEGEEAALIERLGVRTGKGCVYIKRLSDVDGDALRELIERSIRTRREADRASRGG
jgi:hypothetical protein